MQRRQFLQLAFTLSVAGGTFLVGCGGGGNKNSIDTGSGLSRQQIEVIVEAPGGRSLAGTRVATFISENAVNNGRAATTVFESGPQFARLISATGATTLIGFISPDKPNLSARTTAEASLYFHLGGFLLEPPLRVALLNELAASAAVIPLAETMTQILSTADSLDLNEPRIVAAIEAARNQLLGTNRGRAVRVEPGGTLSGVSVLNTGLDTIKIQNLFRRRACAFIERTSYKDAEGTDHPIDPPQEIYRMEIAPLSGVPSVVGATVDILVQMTTEGTSLTSLVPSVTGTLTLPVLPMTAQSTEYRVTLCGAGISAGDQARITSDQEYNRKVMVFKQYVLDILMPLVLGQIFPAIADGKIPTPFPNEGYNESLSGIATFFNTMITTAPDIWAKADAGDNAGAVLAALQALVSDGTAQTAFFVYLYRNVSAAGGGKLYELLPDIDEGTFVGKAASVFNILGLADRILGAADLILWGEGITRSNRADIWTVTVNPSKVKLLPATADVAAEETVELTANLVDAPEEGLITYLWTLSGSNGVLKNPVSGETGASLNSGSGKMNYIVNVEPEDGAKDTITVEAFLGGLNASDRRSLGKANSVLTIGKKGDYMLESFVVDDNLTVWLNDTVIFEDVRGAYAGSRGPFTLKGKVGDKLRIQVQDWYGHYASVGDLVLVKPNGKKRTLSSAFQITTPSGNKTIIFDETYTLD